jgi:hypothetical protein
MLVVTAIMISQFSCTSQREDCNRDNDELNGDSCHLVWYSFLKKEDYLKQGDSDKAKKIENDLLLFSLSCLDYFEKKTACEKKSGIIPAFVGWRN